jgi:hypothetical protein
MQKKEKIVKIRDIDIEKEREREKKKLNYFYNFLSFTKKILFKKKEQLEQLSCACPTTPSTIHWTHAHTHT